MDEQSQSGNKWQFFYFFCMDDMIVIIQCCHHVFLVWMSVGNMSVCGGSPIPALLAALFVEDVIAIIHCMWSYFLDTDECQHYPKVYKFTCSNAMSSFVCGDDCHHDLSLIHI